MNLFQEQPDTNRSINAIKKCINKDKKTPFDVLRLKMIKELKK